MEALKPTQCNLQLIRVIFVITKDRKIRLQYKEKTDKSMVPLVTTYHTDLKNLNSILRYNLPILFTKERMTEMKGHGSGS